MHEMWSEEFVENHINDVQILGVTFRETAVLYVHAISIHTYSLIELWYTEHTFSTAKISRVWNPSIFGAHGTHHSLWDMTWVTAVE